MASPVAAIGAGAAVTTASGFSVTLEVSTHHVPAKGGGAVKFTVDVTDGTTCQLFSAPQINSIDKSFPCGTGTVVKKERIPGVSGSRSLQFDVAVTSPSGVTVSNPVTVTQSSFGPAPSAPGERDPLRQSGSGPATTNSFAIPNSAGGWGVNWSYSCPYGGSFNYDVYSGNSIDFNDQGPLDLNSSGSNVDYFSDGGLFDLQIVTECDWTVEVYYFPATPAAPSVKKPPVVTATLASSALSVPQAGGQITLTATTSHATWCTFLSSPPIPGLSGRAKCGSNGTTTAVGSLPPTAAATSYEVSLIATGTGTLSTTSTSFVERDPVTLVSISGSGNTTTSSPSFSIPPSDSQWSLTWSYNCPSQTTTIGTYSYTNPVDGFLDITVSSSPKFDYVSSGVASSGSATQTFTDTGTFALSVYSYGACNWTVSVVG